MNLEKYSPNAQEIFQDAQTKALAGQHQKLADIHLLSACLNNQDCVQILSFAGADIDKMHGEIALYLNNIPKILSEGTGLSMDVSLAKILEKSQELARKNKDAIISVENLLLAIVSGDKMAQIFKKSGGDKAKLERNILTMQAQSQNQGENGQNANSAIAKYSRDLTAMAKQGKLDPVIGRDEEIRRAIQILSRRTKNNPILIGEPGVGKTAIAEGLATRIINGDVPESLFNKRLISIDLSAILAGAKYRGEFEERLKALLKEIGDSMGQIICFIDEIHALVGAGRTDGAMDASNMLKPMLARGELHCIGATTLDEYRKYIEKDPALARRFQSLFVAEPSVDDTITILRGLKEKYELHHGVRIADSAIIAAANLSNRYISDRFMPDKAIDLMDEAASRLKMAVDSKPEIIDELDRKIIHLKIEQSALQKETDFASKERLKEITKQLAKLEETATDYNTKWQIQKTKNSTLKETRKKLDEARAELLMVQRSGDYAKAGELTYSIIPALEKTLNESQQLNDDSQIMIHEIVSENDIAAVVARATGIPMDKLLGGEKQKLLDMEKTLGMRIIGQDEALHAMASVVRRARAGLNDAHRPLGSFLFLGPTGVGKTEACKALAEFLFADDKAIARFDMSEYMEKHSVARLIGAPPGYVGYDQGGALTEIVRRRPYQILLFDEIEKAHHDVHNILLQILDDGRLTDGQGNIVNFKNCILVMTSNIGAQFLLDLPDDAPASDAQGDINSELKRFFRPEFLNRIDETILFNRLSKSQVYRIVQIQCDFIAQKLQEHQIFCEFDEKIYDFIANKAYSPEFGARPIRRAVQNLVQNPLADGLLNGSYPPHSVLNISAENGNIIIKNNVKN